MDLHTLFYAVLRRKITFFASVFVFFAASVAIWKFAPRIYDAEALILFDQDRTPKQDGATDAYSNGLAQDRYMKSQIKIATGEPVILDTIAKMRGKFVEKEPAKLGLFSFLSLWSPPNIVAETKQDQIDELIAVQSALKVDMEPNTDLLKISFRDKDPAKAAAFANQLAMSFTERHTKLYSNPLAAKFFQDQEVRSKMLLAEANRKLERYSMENGIYSVETQRKLLLARREKIQLDLSSTQATIARLQGELDSLRLQLSSLKSKINLPTEIFGDSALSKTGRPGSTAGSFGDDPPLLHVKLYQESSQKIINDNAELAGVKATEAAQLKSLKEIDQSLNALAEKAASYSQYERDVDQQTANIALYARKSTEADVQNTWRANDRLSTVQLVQPASVPVRPVFPRGKIVVPLGIFVGFVVGFGLVMILEMAAGSTNRQRNEEASTVRKGYPTFAS